MTTTLFFGTFMKLFQGWVLGTSKKDDEVKRSSVINYLFDKKESNYDKSRTKSHYEEI